MTTTEIRLKCLELALNTKGIQPDAFNFIKEAKIYENYLLGITEQNVEEKEEPLPTHKELTNKELLKITLRDFFDIGNDRFEIKDSEGYGSLESYFQRLSGSCNHH